MRSHEEGIGQQQRSDAREFNDKKPEDGEMAAQQNNQDQFDGHVESERKHAELAQKEIVEQDHQNVGLARKGNENQENQERIFVRLQLDQVGPMVERKIRPQTQGQSKRQVDHHRQARKANDGFVLFFDQELGNEALQTPQNAAIRDATEIEGGPHEHIVDTVILAAHFPDENDKRDNGKGFNRYLTNKDVKGVFANSVGGDLHNVGAPNPHRC